MTQILQRFSPATRAWFETSFAAPTQAQAGAWRAISQGEDALVVAPTGSGKTLSAFLWALDRLSSEPVPEDPMRRCRVLYISPLKALAVDVERNLRAPLVGIRQAAARLGLDEPNVTIATRSGDTPASERRAFATRPTDILITTPESLFLLLTSQAGQALAGVETVIIDEIHALAGTKRGAHLAVSLERLDALRDRPTQRIGLSATVRPVEEVGRFLSGGRPVTTVQPESHKEWDLEIVSAVPDMTRLAEHPIPSYHPAASGAGGDDADDGAMPTIWPHVDCRLVEQIHEHRSTIVFTNSRGVAERLTARLNEVEQATTTEPGAPAQIVGASGTSRGADGVLARAHHGSVSKEARAEVEAALKSGALPAVVATSSLELGIDMDAVDLVAQIGAPPSVASGLQRIGRAGHQVGATSRGTFYPTHRGDLVQTAVVAEQMLAGGIEDLRVPATPLDVLAQQIVAMCSVHDWSVGELHELMRRSAPFAGLSRAVLEAVLDMLTGRYPSEEFSQLRPRVVWDRVSGMLSGRPGSQRLAVTSGGTIPDRGMYGVFLAGGDGPGRRVGELDEEMVYESRAGDVFTLGTTSWRIQEITNDQVLVTPAPGLPGRLPFWRGEGIGRPAELGRQVGAFMREVAGASAAKARERLTAAGLDQWAQDNLLEHLRDQREATGSLPSDRTIVVERFRDELGDWRIVVHSPYGSRVHGPWALCVRARLQAALEVDAHVEHGDDGLVLHLPDTWFDADDAAGPDGASGQDVESLVIDALTLDPDDVEDLVTEQIGGSAVFAARFRECAARALLLPQARPGKRQALWQQRQSAAQLLEVAAKYPSFPIVLEAVRECLQDVFDVPGLVELMRGLQRRSVALTSVQTPQPSPFAKTLLQGYIAQFLYEGDAPLAERRAAALTLDPELLADLLGRDGTTSLRDLLDPQVVADSDARLQLRTLPLRGPEDVADLVRRIGPIAADAVGERSGDADPVPWLEELEAARRLVRVRVAGEERWAAIEDVGRLRDALGVPVPPGVGAPWTDSVPDPLGDLVRRYSRCHGPFMTSDLAGFLGLGVSVVTPALDRLASDGALVAGRFRPLAGPAAAQADSPEWCDADVLRTLRRRSLAALRQEAEPVDQRALARLVPAWQHVGTAELRGLDGLARAVEQLAGARLPASALETLVLPARVRDYTPAMLDELMAGGEVLWQGHGPLGSRDGWVSLHLADTAHLTMTPPPADHAASELHQRILDALDGGGAWFFRDLYERLQPSAAGSAASPNDGTWLSESSVAAALWELAWAGMVGNDSLAPVRALTSSRGAHRTARRTPRRGRYGRRMSLGSALRPPSATGKSGPGLGAAPGAVSDGASVSGRWSRLPSVATDPTVRAVAAAEVLLDRYAVLTRGAVAAEDVPGGFAATYRVLAQAEQAGRVRRGYFVDGLGASQFGTVGAIDRLRAHAEDCEESASADPYVAFERARTGRPTEPAPQALVLAATDPANTYGAALPWPEPPGGGHRAGRKAGAVVALLRGRLIAYLERGGKTLLVWPDSPSDCAAAARALTHLVQTGQAESLRIDTINGEPALTSSHAMREALTDAGFHITPQGLRIRRTGP